MSPLFYVQKVFLIHGLIIAFVAIERDANIEKEKKKKQGKNLGSMDVLNLTVNTKNYIAYIDVFHSLAA